MTRYYWKRLRIIRVAAQTHALVSLERKKEVTQSQTGMEVKKRKCNNETRKEIIAVMTEKNKAESDELFSGISLLTYVSMSCCNVLGNVNDSVKFKQHKREGSRHYIEVVRV